MDTRLAFNTGWVEGSTDADTQELSAREIESRHPGFSPDEVTAYHNGRTDALLGDTFRFNLVNGKDGAR